MRRTVDLHASLRPLRVCALRVIFLCIPPILSLIPSVPSFGKSDDREQPLHVVADRADLNQVSGVGVYRGKVRITQGSMVLTADEVTVVAPGGELQNLIAQSVDERARFRQLTDDGQEITARAMRMEYEPSVGRITLLEDAVLRNAANRFAAHRIVYHVGRQVVDAGGGEAGGRVEMTLVPRDGGASPANGR